MASDEVPVRAEKVFKLFNFHLSPFQKKYILRPFFMQGTDNLSPPDLEKNQVKVINGNSTSVPFRNQQARRNEIDIGVL